ncbi:delta-like protein A, partial [Anneissia japonica]|uniref:delta-like protein A n=1 Tax=Anneissia japonica TaxID=1529436 RepID=UPI0014255AA4
MPLYLRMTCNCDAGCSPNPCPGGNMCTESGNTHVCTCPDNFYASVMDCQLYNPCSNNPCSNPPTCSSFTVPVAYQCACTEFTGNTCQEYTICTNNPCRTGYNCTQSTGSNIFKCSCPAGYLGDNCDVYN